MHKLYERGFSLAGVATAFGTNRQNIYKILKRRGWQLRNRPYPLPFIMFNGNKYTRRNTGYYGRTNGKRALLHRDMWEAAYGPIPNGYDVHHKDRDRLHNQLDNFELMDKSEHTRKHHAERS